MEENNITVDKAVQTIKGAILRAQAQASQSSNAIQLSLYYGIGRYVSINLQQAHWGAKALETISERLQRELPGLRGFSSGNLKKMRRIGHFAWFFEQNMPLWVKLRGRFLAVLFGILQTTLYLSIAV